MVRLSPCYACPVAVPSHYAPEDHAPSPPGFACAWPVGEVAGWLHRIAPSSAIACFVAWSGSLVRKDQREVCPLSRRGMLHLVSAALHSGFRFLPLPLPALLSTLLALGLPRREEYGLTLLRSEDRIGLGSLWTPAAWCVHGGRTGTSHTRCVARLAQAR